MRHDSTLAEPAALLDRLPEPQRSIAARLAEAFAARGHVLYLVGGVVRDLLLGRPIGELDGATSAPPALTKELAHAVGAEAVYTVGEAYGTIGLVVNGVTVEITTFRAEVYPTPDRHPVVTFIDRLEADLARRDFTINAMALDPLSGALVDPFDGQGDLARRLIRAVGDPIARFHEDPLRMLRAVRFAAQLGFAIEPATLQAIRTMASELGRVSVERIAAELDRLLLAPQPSHGLALLHESGLLAVALPELLPMAEDRGIGRHKDIWRHTLKVVDQTPPRLAVRWAALLHDAAKPMTRAVDEHGEVHFFGHDALGAELARRVLRRLRKDKALTERVAQLVAMHLRPAAYDETWTDSAVRRLMVEAGDLLDDLLDLAAADVTSARAERRRQAARRLAQLRAHIDRLRQEAALAKITSPLDGHALMAHFGLPPGRWIAGLKAHLRELVLDGVLAPTDLDAAWAEAERWMAAHAADYGITWPPADRQSTEA